MSDPHIHIAHLPRRRRPRFLASPPALVTFGLLAVLAAVAVAVLKGWL